MINLNKESKRLESFSKIRTIKVTQSSDRGNLFTEKSLLDRYVQFESLLEESIYQLLDHDPNCIDMESQPIKILNTEKKGISYYPDTWAKFKDGTQFLFDIKHQDFLDSLKNNPEKALKWNQRFKCIKNYCDKNGLFYDIITENEIWNERHENVDFFEKDKKEPDLLLKIKPLIDEILDNQQQISRINLAIKISEETNYIINDIIHSIDYLVYHDYFLLDFDTKITDNTDLQLKQDQKSKITPIYKYFLSRKKTYSEIRKNQEISSNTNNLDFTLNNLDLREFDSLKESVKKKILLQIKYLEIFDQVDISTNKVKEYANKININYSTLYRWKKKYEQFGWNGLIPNHEKAGRKKGFGDQLEDLIQEAIEKKYLLNTQPSIMSSYRFFKVLCINAKINEKDIPHYDTFRNRIQEISNSKKTLMRKGRKVARDTYKPLIGEYPFGKHPLALVEFDHTQLDVILVDRRDRQPIGRPTLTLAIDVYSRMIYGYYLSFDPPDTIAVSMCLLNGIFPKDEITKFYQTENEWKISGIPKNILLDNSKEFRSKALFDFCYRYKIKMRFNPVHRPDLKPHIERVFRTINESIRDDGILGYTSTIQENRKTKYDPSKHAIFTIEELETWLIHWIVDEYHMRFHGGLKEKEGLKITPQERYNQGLIDSEERLIGTPYVPKNKEQLHFDLLPSYKRRLQREGISLFSLKYYNPIINKLRELEKSSNTKYIVKYDPRDIREIYLWVDSMNKYFKLFLNKNHLAGLLIDPTNPNDYPLSKKEFELIKRNRANKVSLISQRDLAKTMANRQQIIEDAISKKKTAKASRKRKEKIQHHKLKSTSTQIRKREEVKESK